MKKRIMEFMAAFADNKNCVFFWEYFRNRKDNTLNRMSSKRMNFLEALKYPEGKEWLQAGLFYMPPGRGYIEILTLNLKGEYSFYDKTEKQFVSSRELTQEFVTRAILNT